MSTSERFDREFAGLLGELAQPDIPDYFEEVLTRAVSVTQRPAWTFPGRWIPMGVIARRSTLAPVLPWRTIGLLLLLLVLLATAIVGAGAMLLQQRPAPPFGTAANGVIAYSQDGDIYASQPDGSQARLVIGGPTNDGFPWYSRDGRSLYFIRLVSEKPDVIAVMAANADGSGERMLVEPEEANGLHWWTFSPQGDVMMLANESVTPRFSMISLADGTRTALDLPVEVNEHEWLPAGNEIVLLGRPKSGAMGIYGMHPDGSDLRPIVAPRAGEIIMGLSVSDDGRYIAYSVRVGSVVGWRLHEIATGVDTTHVAPIGQHQSFSTFAPDSSRVAFVRYSNERLSMIDAQVFVGPLDDPAAAVAVGPTRRTPSGTAGVAPRFSPDGTKLVIASDEGETETWLVDIATGQYEELPIASALGPWSISWQRRAP